METTKITKKKQKNKKDLNKVKEVHTIDILTEKEVFLYHSKISASKNFSKYL